MQNLLKYLLIALLSCYGQGIMAQDCDFPLPPGNTCAEAPLLCNLDGYCSNNGAALNSGTPNAFCGIVENNNWVKFIAGSETFDIAITVSNCNNNAGLQAQFFQTDDCQNFTSVSNCLDPVNGTGFLTASGLIIGEVYYLMMDGKGGDICDYSYEVTEGIILSPAEAIIDSAGYLCEGETLLLDGSASAGGSGISYQWTTPDGNILSDASSNQIEIDAPGTYQILVTDSGGCTDSTAIQIPQAPLDIIEIEVPDTLDCLTNQTVMLSGSNASGGDVTFLWTTQNGNILSGENTPNPLVDAPGIYLLTLFNTITECSVSSEVEVISSIDTPVAVATAVEELNCLNEVVTLLGEGSSMGNNFIYQWSSMDGNIVGEENSINALANTPGTYLLEVTNVQNDCVASDAVLVLENPEEPSGADIRVVHPCFDENYGSIEIESVTGGTPPYTYAFDGLNFSTENFQGALIPDSYLITIRDNTGCEWDTIVHIEFQPELMVGLGEDISTQLGCEVELEALINFPLENIDSIYWSFATDCSLCPEQTVNPLQSAIYAVTVEDVNGCKAHDEVLVRLEKKRLIFIPNIFTPNFDGTNDLLMIYGGKGVKQVKTFRIFNRWGAMVFQQNHFQPNDPAKAWDGYFKGQLAENGVFVYFAEVEFVDGWTEVFRGDFILIK